MNGYLSSSNSFVLLFLIRYAFNYECKDLIQAAARERKRDEEARTTKKVERRGGASDDSNTNDVNDISNGNDMGGERQGEQGKASSSLGVADDSIDFGKKD
jgi:hypothetical protein